MNFTDRYIATLKPAEKEYRVAEKRGFCLRVLPSGLKIWTYRYRIGHRDVKLLLGHYPGMSLADARKAHAEAWHIRKSGGDPAAIRRDEKRIKISTVGDLATVYLEEYARKEKKSWQADERALNADILPAFRHIPINELRRRDVLEFLWRKEKTAPNQAWQTLKILRRMFNFALEIDTHGLDANPCAHIRLTTPEPKDRVLSREEIKLFWHGLSKTRTADALRMILLTGQRPGEVAGMHRREISGTWWTIPPERSKNGKPNRVYLTKTALDLIGTAKGYIFPGEADKDNNERPIARLSVGTYLRRQILGDQQKRAVKGLSGRKKHEAARKLSQEKTVNVPIEACTPHDLRRTAATRMAEIGIAPHTIARVLNHTDRSVTAMHYNLYSYDAEKQDALAKWETELLAILQ